MGVCTCKTGAGIRMVFASRARWECGASVRTPATVLPEPECSRARVLCPHSRARVLFSVERLAGPRVRLACLVYNYVLVHALSPSVLLALALLPAKPTTEPKMASGIFAPVVAPPPLRQYIRILSDTERLVGPCFSCTVDGDGPPHGPDPRVTIGTWNVHGIADSDSGEIDYKRRELSHWIDSCSPRPTLLFLQETWLLADDAIHIDGYTWLGRNRTKLPAA